MLPEAHWSPWWTACCTKHCHPQWIHNPQVQLSHLKLTLIDIRFSIKYCFDIKFTVQSSHVRTYVPRHDAEVSIYIPTYVLEITHSHVDVYSDIVLYKSGTFLKSGHKHQLSSHELQLKDWHLILLYLCIHYDLCATDVTMSVGPSTCIQGTHLILANWHVTWKWHWLRHGNHLTKQRIYTTVWIKNTQAHYEKSQN